MRARRLVSAAPAVTAVLFFASVVVFAVTTTVAVFPGSLQGWQTQVVAGSQPTPASTPSVDFVFGPTPPPLGRGSAQLSVGSDGGAAAQLRHPGYAGTALPNPSPDVFPAGNELTALSYSTYVQVGGTGNQAPYIILDVDYDNNGTADDHLVFEPQYQNSTDCPSNPKPAAVATGAWQTWDALGGCWYSTGRVNGTHPAPSAVIQPLRTISAAQPNAKIVNTAGGDGGVRIAAGFGGVIGGGAAGDWAGFVGNVDAFTIGVGFDPDTGPNGTTYDFEPKAPPVPASRGVIISELRNSGPACGCGGADEYVELYNTTDNDIAIFDEVGVGAGAGWALVRRGTSCVDPPVVVAVIPNGTIIPARGHYLLAGDGYSLDGYPAGDGSASAPQMTAVPDQPLAATIAGDVDVGLFNTTDLFSFDLAHRLDAVGFNNGSGGTCDLLTEGTPLPNTRDSASEYAFVRKEPLTGGVQDTNNNAADFWEVSITPQTNVGDNAAPVLGAPGPQNTSSPVNSNDRIAFGLTAPAVAQSLPPNRERRPAATPTPEPCSPLGMLLIRRSITNNSGAPVSRLRFRVIEDTTVHSPDVSGGAPQAVLHVRTSSGETLAVPGRGIVQVHGLTDEQAPIEDPAQCGGLNTSLSDDTVTLQSPLAPGATIDVVFLLGIEQTGHFRFYVNVEALESSAPASKPAARPASSKRPRAMPVATPGKPPATSTAPPGVTGVTSPATPPAAPTANPGPRTPASRDASPPATQGEARPARRAITPGVWRKLSPDATPDEPPDEPPAARRTRRDPR